MTKLWVLQHVWCETLGLIGDAVDAAGLTASYVRTFLGEPVPPDMSGAAGLVVMGGPMGVYDHPRHPHLRAEMSLIESALRDGKPVLGVCLGSQLLAHTLGAAVTKGKQKEIGWYPVRLSESAAADSLLRGFGPGFTAYHWHGDVFDLPRGAVGLAASDLTAHQAFRYGDSAYGFLFHMEVTEQIVGDMLRSFGDEMKEAGVGAESIREGMRRHHAALKEIARTVFGRWAGLARG